MHLHEYAKCFFLLHIDLMQLMKALEFSCRQTRDLSVAMHCGKIMLHSKGLETWLGLTA